MFTCFYVTAAKLKPEQWRKTMVNVPKILRGILWSICDLRP